MSLASLRAACALVAGDGGADAASITLDLGRDSGAAFALLRRIEVVAGEYRLRHRLDVRGATVGVHLWREE